MRRCEWRILVPPLLLFSLFAAHVTPSDPRHGPHVRGDSLDNNLAAIPDAAADLGDDSISAEEASDLDILNEELNELHPNRSSPEEDVVGNDVGNATEKTRLSVDEEPLAESAARRNTSAARRWGSHPLPPLEEYVARRDDGGGARWTAYFHDQAIAIIQQSHEGTVLNCTLQEVM